MTKERTKPAPELTPLLKQYQQIKSEHPDHVLFFRCGDFYEMFFDDARLCAEVLGITLTSRGTDLQGQPVPLSGVPYHSVDGYLARMIRAGYRVAMCEQTENPKTAKGVVKREVVRVVTPGTVLEESLLTDKANNYLAALIAGEPASADARPSLGLAALDYSTGEFLVCEFHGGAAQADCITELIRLAPSELVVPEDQRGWFQESPILEALSLDFTPATAGDLRSQKMSLATVNPAAATHFAARQALLEQFGTRDLRGFGVEESELAIRAAGVILQYLHETQRHQLVHLNELRLHHPGEYMVLDGTTQRSLELVTNLTDATRRHTLFEVLDRTATAMGGRTLRGWILQPLRDAQRINERLDAVAALVGQAEARQALGEQLKGIADMERIVSRCACGTANGRDLLSLKNSLQRIPAIRQLIAAAGSPEQQNHHYNNHDNNQSFHGTSPSLKESTTADAGAKQEKPSGLVSAAVSASITPAVEATTIPAHAVVDAVPVIGKVGSIGTAGEIGAGVSGAAMSAAVSAAGTGHENQEDGHQDKYQENAHKLPPAKRDSKSAEHLQRDSACHELVTLAGKLDELPALCSHLQAAIADQPPLSIREGGLINTGYNAELDELRSLTGDSKTWIAALRQREADRTGIPNLKIGYNRVFGYYLEVSNSHTAKVPPEWIRKQTLTNGERYVTPELKEKEEVILNADERANDLEYRLFEELRQQVCEATRVIQGTAQAVARLDALYSLAVTAAARRYVRPAVGLPANGEPASRILIRDGRHPVLETLRTDTPFVPNDTTLDNEAEQILIITGPNMAGKSTYIRQVALITLMAHLGSFVPAAEARICPVDRIFTRVGAMDQIAKGQSTFLVEMSETANILNNATDASLVILDEIGRGTSTYDGLSIAWAVVEYLHNTGGRRPKALFATHYHELAQLEGPLSRVRNYNVAVHEEEERVAFLYRILRGHTDHSYGIYAAQVAGLPRAAVQRARRILSDLEKGNAIHVQTAGGNSDSGPAQDSALRVDEKTVQLTFFDLEDHPVLQKLRQTEINTLTPLQALSLLAELKQDAKK